MPTGDRVTLRTVREADPVARQEARIDLGDRGAFSRLRTDPRPWHADTSGG